jgi:hypothetical protein
MRIAFSTYNSIRIHILKMTSNMRKDINLKDFESSGWHNLSKQNFIPQVSIECVIFGYQDKQLKVLIPKLIFRGDFWVLPTGFVLQDEDVDQAATRIVSERTGISGIYLEQFQVFGKANRNSKIYLEKMMELNSEYLERMNNNSDRQAEHDWFTKRFISIGYYALVDINTIVPQTNIIDESIEWYNIHEIPPMILDNNEILEKALIALRKDIDEKLNVFNLLPEKFTINEVQEIYETIFEKTYIRTNFQKKILEMNVLERLEKKYTGAKNKAPYLYRLKNKDI